MLLKQLELKNFRQYRGTQTVDFSTDADKNVTLFLGKNTSGKTTLIQAFRWVFYNDCNFTGKKSEPKNVLNTEVKLQMRKGDTEEAKVTLIFSHQDITYEVYRRYEYVSKISGDATLGNQSLMMYYYDSNGERLLVKGADSKIKEILPESLSEYFFFDGEKIAASRNPTNVKNSINTIMGLVPLEHMITHLNGGRTNNVENSLRTLIKSDSGVNSINRDINNIKIKIQEALDNRNEASKRYQELDRMVASKTMEIGAIQNLAADAEKLKKLDAKMKDSQNRIKTAETDVIKAFLPAMTECMSNLISADILENMQSLHYEDKGIPEMTAVSVRYILDRGKCICGADLNSNENCRKELEELLSYLPPESIGTQIRHLNTTLHELKNRRSDQNSYDAYHVAFFNQIEIIDSLEEEHIILSERIGKNKDADVLKAEYDKLKCSRDKFHDDEVRYESAYQSLNKQLTELEHKLTVAARADDYNKSIIDKLNYVQALSKQAEEIYEQNSDEILDVVRKTLSDVFNSMYHGQRIIELSDDYKVTLSVGGERLDNSKGLDTVQNFAFIATLLKVAKDRAKLELNSEAYPLAMDAVFSNTDEGHIENICRELPKLAEQAVLAIMDKDWAVASHSLENHVGKKYRIVKESETYSHIEVEQ